MKLSITIPAHNEEDRIRRTLVTYHQFFSGLRGHDNLAFEIIVVLNGCTDGTFMVVEEVCEQLDNILVVDLDEAGKGLAVRAGFTDALKRDNDLIGFVDADMATAPEQFYDLATVIEKEDVDGAIASRYAPGAIVSPPRPAIKRWGSRIFYEPLVWLLFGMRYHDLQCGAKLFRRKVVEKVVPQMTVDDWAFDAELLYLCKKFGFKIKEVPTIWHDQAGSKLSTLGSGLPMLWSLITLRKRLSKNQKLKL